MNPYASPAKAQPAGLTQDLYPTLDKVEFSPVVAKTMRSSGLNPTQFVQQFDKAHASGDFETKAKLANQYAFLTDQIQGGSAATNFLDSHRLRSSEEVQPVMNSVSKSQAFYGSIFNGFMDMVESAPQLIVAGAGLTGIIDKQQFKKSHDGIEKVFDGMKTYVSQDYQKPLISYDDQTGLSANLDIKSFIGTTGNLLTYILPGLITGGAASIATIGTRKALQAATTSAERMILTKTLGKAGQFATKTTGISSFMQTFPLYQREALAQGLDIQDATLFAIPVAGINSIIETANMGNLTKALGISEKAAKAAIREASVQEATQALSRLAGKELTPQLLMETGREAAKNALDVISRPEQVGAFGKLVSGIGGRLKRGFLEQGIPEGGEEFTQGLVEQTAKQLFNNLKDSDTSGRFDDPSFSEFAFDQLYGTALGAVVGTMPGAFLHTRQADPTVFGYVAANVRDSLRKNVSLDDMLSGDPQNPSRLKMLGVLDNKLERQQISEEEHADLTGKVSRMAQIAQDFAGVEGFSEPDRHTMFSVSEAKYKLEQRATQLSGAKAEFNRLSQVSSDASLSVGERMKADIAKGQLRSQLGNVVSGDPASPVFQAEADHQAKSEATSRVVEQAMEKYGQDEDRKAINSFVSDNLSQIDTRFGEQTYPDEFKPAHIVTDPSTGKLLVTDSSKLMFRGLTRTGGQVTTPAMLDENGEYTPAVRSAVSDTYADPVDNLDEHLSLATAISQPSSPLSPSPYKKPDNSEEASWLADGQELVQTIGQLSQLREVKSEKKKRKSAPKDSPELSQAKVLGTAYLKASNFLSNNPDYQADYQAVASQLKALIGIDPASQTEQNAAPIGEEVNLLNETQSEPVAENPLTTQPGITPTTNESTTRPREVSIAPDLGTVTQGSPAEFDDFTAELQRSAQQEQRAEQNEQLQKATIDLADALDALAADADTDPQRLLDAIARANESLESQLDLDAAESEQRPADEGVSIAGPTDAKKQTLAAIWASLPEESQREVRDLARLYADIENGAGVTELESRIISNPPRIKNFKEAFIRIMGDANFLPIMETQYGARKGDESAPTLDQYVSELSSDLVGQEITEQDVIDFVLENPTGIDSFLARLRRPIKEQFRALTGKDINKLSAQNVLSWSEALEPGEPGGVEEFSDEDLASAEQLLAELSDEEVAYLGDLFANYQSIHGEDWLIELNQDARADRLLVSMPDSVSNLIDSVVASAIFANNQQALSDVSAYLQQQFPRPGVEPVPTLESQSAGNNPGEFDSGPSQVAAAPEISRPTADTLESAAEAIAENPEQNESLAEPLKAEIDSQLAEAAASDARTAEATARVDIALADNQKQQERKQKEIDGLKKQVRQSVQTGELFSEAVPEERVTDEVYRAFRENSKEYVLPASLIKAIAYRVSDSTADTRDMVIYQNRREEIQPFVGKKKQGDLFATDTSGVAAQDAAKQAIAQKESELQALRDAQQSLLDEKARAIEQSLSVQQTSLFSENPASSQSPAPAFQLQENPATPTGSVGVLTKTLSDQFGVEVVTDPAQVEEALSESDAQKIVGKNKITAFRWKGKVYLSPDANENSLFHEFGGIWAEVAKTKFPDLYQTGVKLVRDSGYFKRLQRNSYYKTLPASEAEIEALEQAIGDKGAQFLTQGRKSGFRLWLDELFAKIGNAIGFVSEEKLADTKLSRWADQVISQMQSGEVNASQIAESDTPAFQLEQPDPLEQPVTGNAILGSEPTSFEALQKAAVQYYQSPASFANQQPGATSRQAFTGVDADLYEKSPKKYTAADKAFIDAVAAQTGFRLVAPSELEYTRPQTLYHLADGQVVFLDKSTVADVVAGTFGKLYQDTTHRGRLYQFVTDYLKPWTNTTAFAELIDDTKGTLSELIRKVQLASARKANRVKNLLQDKQNTAAELLAKFDEAKISVTSYDFDQNGGIITTQKTLPLPTVMEMIALGETQMASYKNKKATHVYDSEPLPGELYERDSSGKLVRKEDHGAQVYDRDTDTIDTIFLPRSEFEALKDRFTTGNGAATGEMQAYVALNDYFNQALVADALAEEQSKLNPDVDFIREAVYYPIRTSGGDSNARMESQGRLKLYDENKRLQVRSGTPKGIVIGNPTQTMMSYGLAVGDIIEYGRLTENMEHLKDAIADYYKGPQRSVLTKFLSSRISDLKTHRDRARLAREESPATAALERSMKRYTTSIFALNIGLPAKQIGSAMAALNQGIIDTKYLLNTKSLATLAKLTAGAYRDAGVGGTVRADGSEQGLSGGLLSKSDTLERPYLDELLGNNLTPDERSKQQTRFASVINRLLDNSNHYVGDVQFEDLGLNEQTLTTTQKALRKYDQFASERLMAATRRADRAPLLYYYEASKLQAEGESLSGDAYWDRVADLTERAMAETYNLDNILERTPSQLSTNFFMKILGMYSSQQQKIANLLIKNMVSYAKAEPGSAESQEARSRLLHSLAWGVFVNAVYVSTVSAATSALLALLSGDEPKPVEEVASRVGYDTVRNVIGIAPGVSSLIVEYFLNATDNIQGNEDIIDVTAISNLKTGVDALIAGGNYMLEEDQKKSESAGDNFVRLSTDFVSKQLGLPSTAVRVIRENLTTDADDME